MLALQVVILQIIVFGAVIFFLRKILYRDTESSVNRLDRVYQDTLNKQKELNQKIETAEKEYNAKKEEAALIAGKLKTQALDEARVKQDEIIKKAKAEAEEVIKRAREAVDKQAREIEKKLRANIVDEAAGLISVSLSPEAIALLHHRFIEEFLEKAKNFDLSGAGESISTLKIRSAIALTDSERQKFTQFVASKVSRPVSIEEEVDQKLTAGVAFQFGTLLLDGSLNNFIREAAETLKKTIAMQN